MITAVTREPLAPDSTRTVAIRATVLDDTAVEAVHLHYVVGPDPKGTSQILEMSDLGDGAYSATLPIQEEGTWVWYAIAATDDLSATGWWPAGAPAKKAWYLVEDLPASVGDIVINEIMYHNTIEKGEDWEWVEIFNASTRDIDLSMWCMKDSEEAHAFYLPMNTWLTPGEFLVLSRDAARTAAEYGIDNVVGDFVFRLDSGGEQVRLFNANGVLMDSVEYEDLSPWPDAADGEGPSLECVDPFADNSLFSDWGPGWPGGSPGKANSIYAPGNHDSDVVINEIMYHPADERDDTQFIELFNRGSQPIGLEEWQFTRGLTHTFPPGSSIPGGGYLVLCKNPTEAKRVYGFTAPAVAWDMGRLDHGGETLALENSVGTTVDIVKYDDMPPWPVAADGFGSSLECINPFADNNHPRNWRASSGQAYWQFVQRTGQADSSILYIYMLDAGECLIDDVRITDVGGTYNYVFNSGFETDESGWKKTGNHLGSHRETSQAYNGNACMHIVATDTGEGSTNCLSVTTSPQLVIGQEYVLSFWVKHLKGGTTLYSRLSGGGIGGETVMAGSGLLCSPGMRNNVFSLDLPPFVSLVEHFPDMPKAYEVGRVVAAVEDDLQVAGVMLQYKSALEKTWISVAMHDDGLGGDAAAGDGLYTATTTTYPSQTVVQYTVSAWDNMGNFTRSPAVNDPKPNHAYFVYNQDVISKLPVYFLTASRMPDVWSDNYVPATFVYGGKVYENVGLRYRGQTSRSYPKKCLKVHFNTGDLFTGSFYPGLRSINLNAMWPDKSYLREKLSFDMFKKMGVAYCECRHVLVYLNGQYWGLFLEVEAPGTRYLKRNGRDDTGNLYKAYNEATDIWGFEKKTNETDGSMADLADFLWGINNTSQWQITDYLNTHTNVDSQIAYNAVNSVLNNSDQPAKNYFLYHDPASDKWEMFPWDLDLTYGRNFELGGGVCNDVIRWDDHIFFGTRIHPKNDGPWNRVVDRFFYPENSTYTEPFRTKMFETTRFVLDNFFTLKLQNREIDPLVELIQEEAARDRARWGTYSSVDIDLEPQVRILKDVITNRRNYLFNNFLTSPNAPKKPGNLYPRPEDYTVVPPVVLQSGVYTDPNADPHAASQWQIREEESYWTECVLDTGEETVQLRSYEVPEGTLLPLKVYYWRVRYMDSTGLWGNWSEETSFAVGIDTDGDGLSDSVETNTGLYIGYTNTGTNPRNPDTDGDGLMDGEEVKEWWTNPTLADTDGDGLSDGDEVKVYLTDPRTSDTDDDGLPDGWEVANQLDPNDAEGMNGPDGDPDNDGMSNLKERIAGTDPQSAQSLFEVASISPNNPGVTLSWQTVAGKTYRVYVSDEPGGEWSPLGEEILGTGLEATAVDESAAHARARYYRLQVQ